MKQKIGVILKLKQNTTIETVQHFFSLSWTFFSMFLFNFMLVFGLFSFLCVLIQTLD